jgi:tetratricopeptide (TPR) repeat protein
MAFTLRGICAGRRLYFTASVAGIGIGAIAAVALTRLPPLTTHRITTPLNSAATIAPEPIGSLPDLPKLLTSKPPRQWTILGGALLQSGLPSLAVPALEQAVADDQTNTSLRVALGEALTLSDRGKISERARAEFESALQSNPNDLVARFYMAHWMLQNGKPKPALVKFVGLMRTVGSDPLWYERLWQIMPEAAQQVGVSRLALEALCVAGM